MKHDELNELEFDDPKVTRHPRALSKYLMGESANRPPECLDDNCQENYQKWHQQIEDRIKILQQKVENEIPLFD